MSSNFKDNVKNNIVVKHEPLTSDTNTKKEVEVLTSNTNTTENEKETNLKKPFILGTKVEPNNKKKPFPLYLGADLQKKLERICKTKKYSRNELIVLMIEYAIENIEFSD